MLRPTSTTLLLFTLLAGVPTHADDWKSLATEQGVELSYQAVGNVARLRIHNTNQTATNVAWKIKVQLGTGSNAERQGVLDVAAGDDVTIATGPYTDAGHPAEVKSLSTTTVKVQQPAAH